MKKTIVFTVLGLLLSMVLDVSAQDTVYWGDSRYMFNPRVQMTTLPSYIHDFLWKARNCTGYGASGIGDTGDRGKCLLMSYYTKDSVTVYGVAIAMDSMDCDLFQVAGLQATLGKHVGGAMTLVDTATAANGLNVNRIYYSLVGNGVLYDTFVPLYEFYFDHPIVVADTFYVGYFKPRVPNIAYTNVLYYTKGDSINSSIICRDPRYIQDHQFCTSTLMYIGVPGWFPILQPCAPPEMNLDVVDDWEKVLSWSGDVQDSFQLSVSEYRQPADSGTIYNLTDTTITFLDGQGDVYFAARVRVKCTSNEAKCPADDRWSPWSEPVYFYFGSEMPDTTHIDTTNIDTTSTGLRLVESGNVDVTLTPNPAAERVTVSAEGMQSVELLGVDGTVIMRREGLMQDEYILDLKGLATGVYMVRVSTAKGTATRRLMVQ